MKKLLLAIFMCFSALGFAYENKETINGVNYTFDYQKAPVRAVSMSHMTTEIMLKLGLAENMIGTAFLEEEIHPSIAADYAKVPVIADKWPSLETLVALKPDFVTGWEVALKKGVDSALIAKHGINMYVPQASIRLDADLNTLFNDFREYGKIFNKEANVEKYIASEQARLDKIQKDLKNKKPVTVFIYDSGDDKPFTIFDGFTTNLFQMINAKNILSDLGANKTWGEASWEQVVAGNPDYIVVIDYSKSIRDNTDAQQKIANFKANPITKKLNAVKNNKFIVVKLSEICPGIRNVDFLERAAKEVYTK